LAMVEAVVTVDEFISSNISQSPGCPNQHHQQRYSLVPLRFCSLLPHIPPPQLYSCAGLNGIPFYTPY